MAESYIICDDPKSNQVPAIDSPNFAKNLSHPYTNFSKNMTFVERPSTSDNKNMARFDFKMQRPSTSKQSKVSRLERGRTRVLSQEEYKELQFSEHKKRVSVKPKEEVKVPSFDISAKRLSFKSNKKLVLPDSNELNEENMATPTPEPNDDQDHQEAMKTLTEKNRRKSRSKKKSKKKKSKTIEKLVKIYHKKTSKEDTRERAHFKNGAEGIFLRVYDVVVANRVLEYLGIGFYHTSIQIYGHEYYYGGHDADITGIVETDIGKSTSLNLKEILLVGYTYYDADDVDLILDEFGKFWQGIQYDPFSHNCNDFSKQVIKHLAHEEGLYEFPTYVNRFAKLSSLLRVWFQPLKNLFGDVVNAPEDEVMNKEDEENKVEQANKDEYLEEPDDDYNEIVTQALHHADQAKSYYITGSYQNSEQSNLAVLDLIK